MPRRPARIVPARPAVETEKPVSVRSPTGFFIGEVVAVHML